MQHEDMITLSERQTAILRAVVEEYISTAQPISSASIADRQDIHTSSATVRNEMARLEEFGLLMQPYISAGRIPTDHAYRYYVNHLLSEMQRYPSDPPSPPSHMRDVGVEATCKLLGELTKYTALALVSGWSEHRLQHVEIAPVGDDQLLVLLVTDNHQVLHSLTTVAERPLPARIRQLNDLLNQEFAGKPLAELTEDALQHAMTKLPHAAGDWLDFTPELVRRGLEQAHADTHMHVEGATYIFEQQDFTNVPRLRALMEALQEESVFSQLFSRAIPGEVTLSIGTENPHPGLEDCAVVFTSYYITEHTTGRVGVLGPKRMHYRSIISTVDSVVKNLDKRF